MSSSPNDLFCKMLAKFEYKWTQSVVSDNFNELNLRCISSAWCSASSTSTPSSCSYCFSVDSVCGCMPHLSTFPSIFTCDSIVYVIYICSFSFGSRFFFFLRDSLSSFLFPFICFGCGSTWWWWHTHTHNWMKTFFLLLLFVSSFCRVSRALSFSSVSHPPLPCVAILVKLHVLFYSSFLCYSYKFPLFEMGMKMAINQKRKNIFWRRLGDLASSTMHACVGRAMYLRNLLNRLYKCVVCARLTVCTIVSTHRIWWCKKRTGGDKHY